MSRFCSGKTKTGYKCGNLVSGRRKKCWQHGGGKTKKCKKQSDNVRVCTDTTLLYKSVPNGKRSQSSPYTCKTIEDINYPYLCEEGYHSKDAKDIYWMLSEAKNIETHPLYDQLVDTLNLMKDRIRNTINGFYSLGRDGKKVYDNLWFAMPFPWTSPEHPKGSIGVSVVKHMESNILELIKKILPLEKTKGDWQGRLKDRLKEDYNKLSESWEKAVTLDKKLVELLKSREFY